MMLSQEYKAVQDTDCHRLMLSITNYSKFGWRLVTMTLEAATIYPVYTAVIAKDGEERLDVGRPPAESPVAD